ncbi:hypothetical protein A1O1_04143 [Capronia coronata CBS 617.96]|uniref:CENP-V/GFA domain-containing protein n=1 Tax=Capronia coronata CBS 617.96 TaxID=1182541 RepID=W9YP74_9EURO|nr:uncharacterized protein A1O1_04143 [Capronia coronata CBS 617.96]EXJ91036.1 hypothetical protein A1O1_04143 [Capronia coronata CBS 617.96]
MIKGSCACGRIQYQTQAQPLSVDACHCGTCQKAGGPFLGFADFPVSELQWTHQPPDMWTRSEIADRGYCNVCGSSLSMQYRFQDVIGITLGTIQAGTSLPRLGTHIFLKEKAPWFVLPDDGAQRWDEFPPEFQQKLDQWNQGRRKSERPE